MKNSLFTFTFILLFKFAHSGYAIDYEPNTLGGLPQELQFHIVKYLSLDDQSRISMVDTNFNAIVADNTKIISETAKLLDLNFKGMSRYCRELLLNVGAGDFTITEVESQKFVTERMVTFDIPNNGQYSFIDDNGHIETIIEPRPMHYRHLHDNEKINLNGNNRDRSIFVGYHSILRQHALENYPEDDIDRTWQNVAVKYVLATNSFVDLFPEEERHSEARSLNSNGTIIVGDIIDQTFTNGLRVVNTYGFIHKDNENVIFLKGTRHKDSSNAFTVSDQGEIVGGRTKSKNELFGHATVWLHDLNNDDIPYRSCLLRDLIMHNCSKAQREMLENVYLEKILSVSPNGKVMLVGAFSLTKEEPKFHDLRYFTIVFGSNVKSKMEDIDIPHH